MAKRRTAPAVGTPKPGPARWRRGTSEHPEKTDKGVDGCSGRRPLCPRNGVPSAWNMSGNH